MESLERRQRWQWAARPRAGEPAGYCRPHAHDHRKGVSLALRHQRLRGQRGAERRRHEDVLADAPVRLCGGGRRDHHRPVQGRAAGDVGMRDRQADSSRELVKSPRERIRCLWDVRDHRADLPDGHRAFYGQAGSGRRVWERRADVEWRRLVRRPGAVRPYKYHLAKVGGRGGADHPADAREKGLWVQV